MDHKIDIEIVAVQREDSVAVVVRERLFHHYS